MIKYFIKKLFGGSPRERLVRGGGVVGENCDIYPEVEFGSEPYLIELGDNVRITNGVKFVTHDGGLWVLRNMGAGPVDSFGKIIIGNNVHIGWNAVIMPNVTVGDNVVIGCGAVVTRDVPPNCVIAGVPARVIETIEEYREKSRERWLPTKEMDPEAKKDYLLHFYSVNDGNGED